jgi:hypothetical protein
MKSSKTRALIALSCGLVLLLAAACRGPQAPRLTVEPLPRYEALFQRESGWTGGDGVFSTPLGPERVLWLFGDTFIGEVVAGRHANAVLVNNTLAIQSGRDPDRAAVEFFHGLAPDGRPEAFIRPADGIGWFWPYHAVRTGQGLFLFLIQIERTTDPLAFGFKLVGTWLAQVANPQDPPASWRITQAKLPWGDARRLFGSALLVEGDACYVYGTVDQAAGGFVRKDVILARAPAGRLADFDLWRFWSPGGWTADVEGAAPVCENVANEFSVSFQPALGRYALVYTRDSLSADIVVRLAPEPHGPWGEPLWMYRCPEAEWDPRIFCYAAKGHPELAASGDELIVTYITNSTDFALIESDARLYRPRFLKARFAAE